MFFQLPKLPYDTHQFEPFMSQEAFDYHYGKHHRGYIDKVNKLLYGSGLEQKNLDEIIMLSEGELFNNAAQAWNHTFFWFGLIPEKFTPEHGSDFLACVEQNFKNLDELKDRFSEAAKNLFGSGWVWLVKDGHETLKIVTTHNGDVPFKRDGLLPLLNCDVWEHAYYIDHRNDRAEFVKSFWDHVNWYFVERNFHREEPLDLTVAMRPRGTPLESTDLRIHH